MVQQSDTWVPQNHLSNVCHERITYGLCNGKCNRDTHTHTKPTVEAMRRKNLSVSSKDWTLGLLPRRPEGFSWL